MPRAPLTAARGSACRRRRPCASWTRSCRTPPHASAHQVDAFVLQLQDTVRPRWSPKAEAFTLFPPAPELRAAKARTARLTAGHVPRLRRGRLRPGVSSRASPARRLLRAGPHAQGAAGPDVPAPASKSLYEIPSNLILMNHWQREGQGAIRREIHAKRRHFHNAQGQPHELPLGDAPAAPTTSSSTTARPRS